MEETTRKRVKKPTKYIEGYSESAWKSLAIKSLRVGWATGLTEASQRLSKSTMRTMLIGGLFEDVFPADWKELNECLREIDAQDYVSLCQRETHHGRGLSEKFCNMADEACAIADSEFYKMMNEVRVNSNLTWCSPRIKNCLYTWKKINPKPSKFRYECNKKWEGMPLSILDSHTFEGKKLGIKMSVLSGHYENHRILGQRVMAEGWDKIRREALTETFPASEIVIVEPTLF